ncbi:hypothetical protein [Frigoriglobus tundricola]|uniref:Uncharacterized protein n=1 Tax=Frigoriglobus tundricola TaxID=2774151 RepID=A0A6M5YI77_9BACT|nr:hypothetical protein [Frigoriglobus tundricola]QJW93244.1 hypothetical protein FTUN_0749 [Frigoriglobus tundricola]
MKHIFAITPREIRLALGYFKITEAARVALTEPAALKRAIRAGQVPGPLHTLPGHRKQKFYHADDLPKLRKHFNSVEDSKRVSARSLGLLSMATVAQRVGCSYSRFCSFVQNGRIPAPEVIRTRRKLYSESQIPEIKKAVERLERIKAPSPYRQWEAEGLFTQRAAAKKLEMPYITFQHFAATGKIPKPTRKYTGNYFPLYNEADLEAVKQCLSAIGYTPNPKLRKARKGTGAKLN